MEYFRQKRSLIPDILSAYESLAAQYDIIVIEGAGSPAEINLKQDDIVNMGMAKMANSPVLLAGDIDRGGVFAQLAGTALLLTEEEKKFVKGTIINKFRGDKSILDPGVGMIEGVMGIPVVGVVPYMQVDIEEEDSLTERFVPGKEKGPIHIAVAKLPRISNFTDFAVLESMEQVTLTYASKASQLEGADMVILPGTFEMAKAKWDGRRHSSCGRAWVRGFWDLRGLPNAWRTVVRPRTGRRRGELKGNGAASGGDCVYPGENQDKGVWEVQGA